eukprot:5193094-Pyramimonas_sp.AAC.1
MQRGPPAPKVLRMYGRGGRIQGRPPTLVRRHIRSDPSAPPAPAESCPPRPAPADQPPSVTIVSRSGQGPSPSVTIVSRSGQGDPGRDGGQGTRPPHKAQVAAGGTGLRASLRSGPIRRMKRGYIRMMDQSDA